MIREIPASELVKGDIVLLEAGAQVAADLRLVKTWNLKVEESALTGESLPVSKDAAFQADKPLPVGDRKNEAFMSTLVTSGRGEGIVIGAGMDTEIGKIAAIISDVPKEFTPLQKKLAGFGKDAQYRIGSSMRRPVCNRSLSETQHPGNADHSHITGRSCCAGGPAGYCNHSIGAQCFEDGPG